MTEHRSPEQILRDASRDPALASFLSAAEWLKRDFAKPQPLLGEVVVTGVRMFLVGRTGLGKTLLGFAMAVAMATGTDFLHWKAGRPCKVLYLDGEMPAELIQQRLRDAIRRHGADLTNNLMIFARDQEEMLAKHFPTVGKFEPLNTEAGHNWLLAFIEAIGGVDVIVLDNVMSLLQGDQKDEVTWSGALPLVDALSRRRIAQIWLDHTPHTQDRQYGSATKAWRFDAVGLMGPLEENQRDRGEVAFSLSFDPPGKARRRTPDNWRDFETTIIRLNRDKWTSEPANTALGEAGRAGKLAPSRRPFYDALTAAITASSEGPGRTTLEAWQRQCERRGLIEQPAEEETYRQRDSRYRDFRRAKGELIAAGWIAIEDTIVIDLKSQWS